MEKTVQHCISSPEPKFDKKYKVVVKSKYSHDFFEKLEWAQVNSHGSVDVGRSEDNEWIYFAFEESDDALFFKIKYRV
jgi:Ni,Fe-hydrogenase III component G